MKKLILVMLFAILLVGNVSAFEFDNVYSYDEKTKTVVVENVFGLGSDLAEIQLISPQIVQIMRGKDRKVAEFTIDNLKEYQNVFNNLKFYNLYNDKEIEREFTYKYKTIDQELIIDYEWTCENKGKLANGSNDIQCWNKVIGSHYKDVDVWNVLDTKIALEKGKLTIGIFTDVYARDRVEWIPTLFGVEITEWAIWTDALDVDLLAYWTFDDANESIGNYNITNDEGSGGVFTTIGCLRGGCGNVTTNNNWKVARSNLNQELNFLGNHTNKSISFWIKPTTVVIGTEAPMIRSNITGTANPSFVFRFGASNYLQADNLDAVNGNWQFNQQSGNWTHYVITTNTTTITYYVNGTQTRQNTGGRFDVSNSDGFLYFGSDHDSGTPNDFVGYYDEMGFWNRTLLASEVDALYNNGTALGYERSVTVTLNSPADATTQLNPVNFNCSAVSDATIINISLWIDGSLNYTETGGTTFETLNRTLVLPISGTEEIHNWTCLSHTAVRTDWGTNRTVTTRFWIEESLSFNATTYETSVEGFVLNLSFDSSVFINAEADLIYNGTSYSAAKIGVGNNFLFTRALEIPLIQIGLQQNNSFHFEVTLYNGTSSDIHNSSFNNQTVYPIVFEECGTNANITALNFTAYNEFNLTRITPFEFKGSFEYWIGSEDLKKNLTINNDSTDEIDLCISQNSTFHLNALIEYDGAGLNNTQFTKRTYYFNNFLVNNVTTNISLLLLASADSTSFIQYVTDNTLGVANAYIYTYRYYPGTDTWIIVQSTKTDSSGKTVAFYETETALYKHTIVVNGVTRLEETEGRKIFPESTPYTLTFEIGAEPSVDWSDVENDTYSTTTSIFNSETYIHTFTWAATTTTKCGVFQQSRLYVEQENYSTSNSIICNVTSAVSSGTLTCDLTSYEGNFISWTYITTSLCGEQLKDVVRFFISEVIAIFGNLGLLMAWFIILTAGMIALWHPIAGIVSINMAIWFVNLIQLAHFGGTYIFGVLIVSIILIWVLKD